MFRQFSAAAVVAALLFVLVTGASAQEVKDHKAHKEAKQATTQVELKSVSCDPMCGFKVRSHDEKELISIVKTHAKNAHSKEVTGKEVKDMMKTEKAE